MRKFIIAGIGAATALALTACSEKAQDQVEQAGEAVGNDLESGINNADDVIASGVKDAGQAIENAGDAVGEAAGDATEEARSEGREAKAEAGTALQNAGKELQD